MFRLRLIKSLDLIVLSKEKLVAAIPVIRDVALWLRTSLPQACMSWAPAKEIC